MDPCRESIQVVGYEEPGAGGVGKKGRRRGRWMRCVSGSGDGCAV